MKTVADRLLERSVRVPFCGCRIWEGYLNPKTGYGEINVGGRTEVTHRASWVAFRGPIPEGAHVLHDCDLRCCIEPTHLFTGSNTDNIHDSMRKGRRKGVTRNRPSGLIYIVPKGAHDVKLKVPRDVWPTIAARCAAGETQTSLALVFNVHPSTISHILTRLRCAS